SGAWSGSAPWRGGGGVSRKRAGGGGGDGARRANSLRLCGSRRGDAPGGRLAGRLWAGTRGWRAGGWAVRDVGAGDLRDGGRGALALPADGRGAGRTGATGALRHSAAAGGAGGA